MGYFFAKATVDDVDEWKSNFDANDTYRTEHGRQGFQAFHSADDPNEVDVLFEWDDRRNARALFDSEEWHEKLVDGGVKG